MTSFRQLEANQRNSLRSTGPKTEEGKRRSRRNAIRHGLCAETVIEVAEDIDDYKRFVAAITADFDVETAVEGELVLRLASLLWRIRRATSIETDLIRFQAEIVRGGHTCRSVTPSPTSHYHIPHDETNEGVQNNGDGAPATGETDRGFHSSACRDLAHSFQRLNNLGNGAFERVGRYESALWRQIVQLLFVLRPLRRHR